MVKKKTKKIKVKERKLGREKALGLAWFDKHLIELDPRQKSKCFLDSIIHEVGHLHFPKASEAKIKRFANELTKIIWNFQYRRIQK